MTARSLLYSSHHLKLCVKHSGNCRVLPKMCRVSKLDNELPSLLSCGLELMVLPSSSFRQPLPSPTKLLYRLDTARCNLALSREPGAAHGEDTTVLTHLVFHPLLLLSLSPPICNLSLMTTSTSTCSQGDSLMAVCSTTQLLHSKLPPLPFLPTSMLL